MDKVIFIPGHTENYPGARAYNGMGEYHFNSALCWELATIEGASIARRYYDNYERYVDSLVNYLPRDVLKVELHTNSTTINNVQGCEAIISGKNYTTTNIAEQLCESFAKRFAIRNRGVKTSNERGKLLLSRVPNMIIFEPFFGHEKDSKSELFLENPHEGVKLMAQFWKGFVDEYL